MSFDNAILALSKDALKFVKDGNIIGLGSGRAATAFVKSLSLLVKTEKIKVKCIPTSLQIKMIAEEGGIELIDGGGFKKIDIVFDGADLIDEEKNLIKGGGGALLKEKILINAAKKVIIIADKSKFVKKLNKPIPVEVHPIARNFVSASITKMGGKPIIRALSRGYPFITENSNIILDCDFGVIKNPKLLEQKIIQIPGVIEAGIFTRKPDVIYKARVDGKFDIIN